MWPRLFILVLTWTSAHSGKDVHRYLNPSLNISENLAKLTFRKNNDFDSKVNMSINVGCTLNNCTLIDGKQVSVINVTVADEPAQEHEQHWIWSVIGRPTVQAAITGPGNYAFVNWSSIFNIDDVGQSIQYKHSPIYSGAVMLMNLIEFDDPNDCGILEQSPKPPVVYPIVNFHWKRRILEDSDQRLAVQFIGTNYSSPLNETFIKGHINLTLSAYSNDGFGHWLPHLSHNSKTSQVDIQLEHLESSSGFNNSRYSVELYIVSNTSANSSVIRQVTTTLDDEHTPGIFKTEELIMPGDNRNGTTKHKSYLQWRPVVYTTRARDLSESSGVNVSQSIRVTEIGSKLSKSLLYVLYGNDLENYLVRRINVTFGSPEDGFFKKTKFQAWTFTFGVGTPIQNGVSPAIVLASTAMLGILLVVLITSGIVCIVKKLKKRVDEQQQQPNYRPI